MRGNGVGIMEIGIFTIAYRGYGKFAPRWCRSIAESTVMPTLATLALFGDDHGLSDEMASECAKILPCLNIVYCGEHISIGADRNKAVEETPAEWVMLLSVDDVILPIAIEEFEKYDKPDIDVIACSYVEKKLNGDEELWLAPTAFSRAEMFNWREYWLPPYSPFRRSFWEKHPYHNGEYPNIIMTLDFARAGARFARTDVPCACHIRRDNSHSMGRSYEEQIEIEKFLDGRATRLITDGMILTSFDLPFEDGFRPYYVVRSKCHYDSENRA